MPWHVHTCTHNTHRQHTCVYMLVYTHTHTHTSTLMIITTGVKKKTKKPKLLTDMVMHTFVILVLGNGRQED